MLIAVHASVTAAKPALTRAEAQPLVKRKNVN